MSILLITGGARSGKSALAETLAEQQGTGVFYIATSVITDEDMAERVRHHRATRPPHWRTYEGYRSLGPVLAGHQTATESVILECITTWVTNLLFDFAGDTPVEAMDFADLERQIALQVDALLVGCHQCAAFPWVGAVVGACGGAVFVGLYAWSGIPLAALATVLTLALITGGLHLDGLADTCDGVFSARCRERMLDIMRDSRLGTFGGLALVFMVVAKTLVIAELALRDTAIMAAVFGAAVTARSAVVILMYRQRYAREGDGLGNLYIGKISADRTDITERRVVGSDPVAWRGDHGVCANAGDGVPVWLLYTLSFGGTHRRYSRRCH